MKINNNKAVTFIEIMVVILISTVVFAGIYSTVIVGNFAWTNYNNSIVIRKEARRALVGMVNELREAENVRVVQSPEGGAVHFYRHPIGTVSYIWKNQGEDANRIIRRNRFDTRILANDISRLSFQYLKNFLVIDVTASKQTTAGPVTHVNIKEKIALRAKTVFFEER